MVHGEGNGLLKTKEFLSDGTYLGDKTRSYSFSEQVLSLIYMAGYKNSLVEIW